ncbi:MAG TPA: hypothetical protein VM871_11240, partial [Flavisolibacter sp.]|nr:hypothetical protein [Flavisolibacter sp.]
IVAIKSYSDVLLTEKRTFSPAKFDKLLLSFKDLKQEPEPNRSDIPVGGSSKAIRFYKDGKEIFHGIDYGRTKNFSGADVDLSYLVPDLQELIAKTKKDTD